MEEPHKKLDVRQQVMKLANEIYTLTNKCPADEKFGLVSQMRRAVVTIPYHIAEGAARQGKKKFNNFLSMAQVSLGESHTQLELAVLLGYHGREDLDAVAPQLIRIDKMLTGLIRNLKK